jgi:hypothetical protein
VKKASRILVLALAGVAAPAVSCLAQDKGVARVLIDRSLQERRVQVTGLEPGTITYAEAGLVRTEPTGEYLAMIPIEEPAGTPRPGATVPRLLITPVPQPTAPATATPSSPASIALPALELVDGQRLTGNLGEAGEGDLFTWTHPRLGVLQLKLDDVQRLRVRELKPSQRIGSAPEANDLLIFANGDRVEGFVEALADPLVITIGEAKREVPLDRVGEVVFANPPGAPAGAFVWLRDGSIIAARELRTTRVGELLITPRLVSDSESPEMHGAGSASVPLAELIGVNFDTGALMPLAAVTPERYEALGGRRWTPPVRVSEGGPLGAGDIVFPGAMSVRWSIPEHITRFSALAELPREAWTWGDCELVVQVETGGAAKELVRQRLSGAAPSQRINTGLGAGPGRTLIVRIEAGELGPIEDRVVLRRPLLAASPAQQ